MSTKCIIYLLNIHFNDPILALVVLHALSFSTIPFAPLFRTQHNIPCDQKSMAPLALLLV